MNITPEMIHNVTVGVIIAIGSMGGAIGQGIAASGTLESITRQPASYHENLRTMFIGVALIESGPIVTLVCSLMLCFSETPVSWGSAYADCGVAFLLSITSFLACIASGLVVRAASISIGRQPFLAKNIFTLMVLAQAIIEAPIIFAFILTSLIQHFITPELSLIQGAQYCAAALALGFGSIGPSIGQAFFASACCSAIGIRKAVYHKIFPFMLLNQTLIDTPLIFSLLFSFLILYTPMSPLAEFIHVVPLIMAAITIGCGSIGSGIGIGYTASCSAYQIAENPENYNSIFKTTLLSVMFIESSTIYAMIIALSLIMKIM